MSGFTFWNDAPNVTRWGLGVGVGYRQSPYKGDDASFSPLPLVYFDNKWIHLFGNKLDISIGRWDNVRFTLRGEYALGDGYKESDAPILDGMQKRKGGFWIGPALAWDTGYGTLAASFLTAGNKGQKAGVDYSNAFDYGDFALVPHAGIDWYNSRYVDYYYGVEDNEARAGRDAYAGKAAYNLTAGVRLDYRLTPHQSLSFDAGVTRLGGGITDSPLVGRTVIPAAKFGYLYSF
ncbi:MipA/OmpV family protein [Enterobacteriales bacterium SAP-6]|uniref:MipA/OmpV family protein n=1 Tax=Acerihabitans arboris TaxID=2691583 RepID=A0A845SL67_9GAMM|nr:MipA/OmpV family protein [Acerihabitans arboris]